MQVRLGEALRNDLAGEGFKIHRRIDCLVSATTKGDMFVKPPGARQRVTQTVTLVGALTIALVAWLGGSAIQGADKLDRQASRAALSVSPPGATLVETYSLGHRVAGAGDYRIEVENFDYGNLTGGFSALRIFNEVGQMGYFEFSQPPLAKGVRPITLSAGNAELLFIMYRLDYDGQNPLLLRVYDIYAPARSRMELRVWSSRRDYARNLSDFVGDFDKDGKVEVLNYDLREPGTGIQLVTAYLGPLAVYRYVGVGDTAGANYTRMFQRVKGRGFEKQFMEHAEWLIGTAYPDMLKAGHQRAAETAILSWLATVANTQNPDRVHDALRKLGNLPHPNAARKRELVGLLVKDGYEQLAATQP